MGGGKISATGKNIGKLPLALEEGCCVYQVRCQLLLDFLTHHLCCGRIRIHKMIQAYQTVRGRNQNTKKE